ncbi:MAG: hypothetical protein JWN29_2026 [Acidimicrobiales bacterium]|nr:hypothetical protein [Acidimicrobiales bacterium]
MLAAAACGAGSSSPAAPSTTTTTPAAGGAWTTYQGDAARHGYVTAGVDPARAARRWVSATLDGQVYAQPLVVGDQVLVATEGDSVYALDRTTGAVRWHTNVGQPVPGRSLPCGNIDPVGITGTPVVDRGAGLLYAVAFSAPLHHELVAIDVATGAVRSRRTIDVPGSDPAVQSQRPALALTGGKVFVAFGGRDGDCGPYRGRVVAVPTSGGPQASFTVAAAQAGIWAPPGPVVVGGDVLVVTGNGEPTGQPVESSSVLRLSPDLAVRDIFTPANWRQLDQNDTDLGSTSPAVLDGGLLLQGGKEGVGYLLDAAHLGGVGGQVASVDVCPGSGAYGGTAVAAGIVLVPCRDGLVAVRVDVSARSATVAWRAGGMDAGTPIVAGSTAWVVDIGRGRLGAFDLATGARQADLPLGPVTHFAPLAAAPSQLFVPTDRKIVALTAP